MHVSLISQYSSMYKATDKGRDVNDDLKLFNCDDLNAKFAILPF